MTPKSPRRRTFMVVVLLALLPLTVAMALRAQAEIRDFQTGRDLFIASESSVHAGDYPRAIEQLEESVRLWPDLPASWESLAWCYHRQGQGDKAYHAFERGIALNPDSPSLRIGLGTMSIRDEKFEQAMASLGKALALDPTNSMAARLRKRAEQGLQSRSKAP